MEKIIATVVGIILVLGLIAYTILAQVDGVRATGDKAVMEQKKINIMIDKANAVTGDMVKQYEKQYGDKVKDDAGNTMDTTDVKDGALYTMEKTYDVNGEIATIVFTQVDLSK